MSSYGSGAVVTPEAVRLDFEAAGVGSRGVARIIDSLIIGAALFILTLAVSLVGVSAGGLSDTFAVVVFIVVVFLALFGYPVAFETLWRGRTLGKAAMGLRVVTTDGAPARFRHTVIRSAFQVIDIFLLFGGVAIVSALATRRHQRLGDLVAGTMVLRQRIASMPAYAARFAPPEHLASYAETVDVSGMTPEDYNVLRSFLLRAATLQPQARDALGQQLADTFARRTRVTPSPQVTVEQFLIILAARYQQRGAVLRPTAPSAPETEDDVAPPPPAASLGDFAPPA